MDTILAAGQYRRICQKVAFACFPAEGYGEYELSLRVLRLPIGNGTYENIPHFLLHLESRFRLWYNSLRKKLTKTMIQERQGGLYVYKYRYQAELPLFFSAFFVWAAAVSLLILGRGVRERRNGLLYGIFALLALFVLPVAITLLTGMAQPIRAHLTYALVFAGYLFLLCAHFPKLFAKWKRLRIAAYAAVAAISLIISWRQMVSVNKD